MFLARCRLAALLTLLALPLAALSTAAADVTDFDVTLIERTPRAERNSFSSKT